MGLRKHCAKYVFRGETSPMVESCNRVSLFGTSIHCKEYVSGIR